MFNSHSAVKEVTDINHFTESNPTSAVQQQAAYDCQFLTLGSKHHWILHAEQTHKQPQQSNMDFHL